MEDSRQVNGAICDWAEEFMQVHENTDGETEQYIEKVDDFAKVKLLEHYGTGLPEMGDAVEIRIADELVLARVTRVDLEDRSVSVSLQNEPFD